MDNKYSNHKNYSLNYRNQSQFKKENNIYFRIGLFKF